MTLEDEFGDIGARNDQTDAGLNQLAAMVWNYRVQLTSHGFSTEEAFDLTRDFHIACLDRQNFAPDNEDDE